MSTDLYMRNCEVFHSKKEWFNEAIVWINVYNNKMNAASHVIGVCGLEIFRKLKMFGELNDIITYVVLCMVEGVKYEDYCDVDPMKEESYAEMYDIYMKQMGVL